MTMEAVEDYLEAAEHVKLGIQARETCRLRRRVSIVMQKPNAYRTLRCVGRQAIDERWRDKSSTHRGTHEFRSPILKSAPPE